MPRLVLAFESATIEATPPNILSVIRVDGHGRTFFESDLGSVARLTVLDSTGRVMVRFAKSGRGPGEVIRPIPVAIDSAHLLIWDAAQLRFSEWNDHGEHMRAMQPVGMVIPAALSDRGVVATRLERGVGVPVVVSLAGGGVSELLAATTPFLTETQAPGAGRVPYVASLGIWNEGFVVARPGDYTVGFFSWDGALRHQVTRPVPQVGLSPWRIEQGISAILHRPLPGMDTTAAGLDRARAIMSRTPLPGFSPSSSIGLDGAGHTLVAGIEGDSAFVDVFSPPQYLGRIGVGCRGFQSRWSVQGDWLAMVCRPTSAAFPGDVTVKLFRMVR